MTTWWLNICAVTFALNSLGLEGPVMQLMKGLSVVCGLCVGVGYYTFCACFPFYQTPMVQIQLWNRLKENSAIAKKFLPFRAFLVLDFLVHACLVTYIYVNWSDEVTFISGLLAFIVHRVWSLVHSGFKTAYYEGADTVYGFAKPLPRPVWVAVNLSETIIISNALIFR